jgi:nucleoid DNA-binding protein
MNKHDIALYIANIVSSKKEAIDIVDKIFEKIAYALRNEEKVTITGLGSFNVFTTKLKKGHNPKTGEKLLISPMKKIRFKPSKNLFNVNTNIKEEDIND